MMTVKPSKPIHRIMSGVFTALALSACGNPATDRSLEPGYFLPELQERRVQGLYVSDSVQSTEIKSKDGKWRIEEPLYFPASADVINVFLQTVTDVQTGKMIKVAPKDYGRLRVTEEDGITVKLTYENGETVKLIFGILDMPRDETAGVMAGLGGVARRYVRKISGSDDAVFLLPISLIDLSSSASLWANIDYIRVPSFRKATVRAPGKSPIVLARDDMYGPLYKLSSSGQRSAIDTNVLKCFEAFLVKGQCKRIAPKSVSSAALGISAGAPEIEVESFEGMSYTLRFGTPVEPSEEEIEFQQMQASFMDKGVAKTLVPVVMTTESSGGGENIFETVLNDKNTALAARFDGRIAYIEYDNFYCLEALIAEAK